MVSIHKMRKVMTSVISLLFVFWLISFSSVVKAEEIAILKSADLSYYEQAMVGFKRGLPANIVVKEYNLDGQLAQGRDIGRSLRASPPNLVFAVGLKAAMAAKLEIFDTPVVFCMVLNPETHGLPSRNMVGIAVRPSAETQLAALRSTMPHLHRVGVLYDDAHSGEFMRHAHYAAKQQGLELVAVSIHRQEDIPPTVRAIVSQIDVLWLIQDATVVSESAIPFFLESTLQAKVPIFTFSSTLVQQGALGALVLDPLAIGQQAASLAMRQIKGARALVGSLQPPEGMQLALNLNSAEYLGITVAPEVIRLAGHLFSGPGAMALKPNHADVIP